VAQGGGGEGVRVVGYSLVALLNRRNRALAQSLRSGHVKSFHLDPAFCLKHYYE